MLFRVKIVGFLFCALTVSPAFAWNNAGHKIVAEIAWQTLDSPTRLNAVDTLRRHPRLQEDFVGKMPEDIAKADEETQGHWVFLHAATWPDIARKTDYDRPWWHFINVPLFPDGERPVTFNQSTDYPSKTPAEKYNCIQAVKFSVTMLRDERTPPDQRALALCWVMHLAGDMHQPLHSTALVCDYFPEGDRGGNKVVTARGKNLHSLWDRLLGTGDKLNDVRGSVNKLQQDRELWNVDAKAGPEKWIEESYELAKSVAYNPAILDAIKATTPGAELVPIELPESYYKNAGDVSRRRVVAAGLRLAAVLHGRQDRKQ